LAFRPSQILRCRLRAWRPAEAFTYIVQYPRPDRRAEGGGMDL